MGGWFYFAAEKTEAERAGGIFPYAQCNYNSQALSYCVPSCVVGRSREQDRPGACCTWQGRGAG